MNLQEIPLGHFYATLELAGVRVGLDKDRARFPRPDTSDRQFEGPPRRTIRWPSADEEAVGPV